MGYRVIRAGEAPWEERRSDSGTIRHVADVTTAGELTQSRARLWRYEPGARGVRHRELAQEEVFVVLAGTLTMLLGDPPERVELPPQSVVSVAPETALQLRNDGEDEVVVFVYGAPPVTGQAEYLPDPDPA